MTQFRLVKSITLALAYFGITACSSSTTDRPPAAFDPALVTGELIISNSDNTADAMLALRNAGTAFNTQYPDVSLTYIDNPTTTHRETIKQTLQTNAPDVVAWYPGNQMDPLIDADLLDDVSNIWAANQLASNMSAFTTSLTRDGKQWGIPTSTYGWGIYYRKDIFESFGISEPKTWTEFQNAAQTLKTNNVTPLTIGTKFLWPSAGIFDHLNLRINGHEVHNDLTNGKINYTDARIRTVFDTWKDMVDNGYFIDGHQDLSWQDAIKPLADGEAAMYLIGNFVVSAYTDATGSSDNLGFFSFPQISTTIATAEEAPTDAFFLPKNANNKPTAKAFLSFISRPEIQAEWNKTLGQIPPHADAELSDDVFVTETATTIRAASAFSHFFDRDAPQSMVLPAFEAFQEFMLDTTKLDNILIRLDEVQLTAY